MDGLVEKLDRIEPPGQMVAILKDPLLQKFAELRPSPLVSTRIDLWLSTCLEDIYETERIGMSDRQYLGEVLNGLLTLAQYTKVRRRSKSTEIESTDVCRSSIPRSLLSSQSTFPYGMDGTIKMRSWVCSVRYQ